MLGPVSSGMATGSARVGYFNNRLHRNAGICLLDGSEPGNGAANSGDPATRAGTGIGRHRARPCPPRTGFEVETRPDTVMTPCSRASGPPPGQASGSRPRGTSPRALLSSRGRRRNSPGGRERLGKMGNGRVPIRTIDGGCGALGNLTATDSRVSYAFEEVSLRVRATNFPGPIRNDLLEGAAFDLLPGTVPNLSVVRAHAYAVQGSASGSMYGEATHA